MTEKKATARRKTADKGPTPLAVNLKQIMAERHLSARGLSLAAGLTGDACRNIIASKSISPRAETVQALAKHLGLTVDQLTGKEPLPPPQATGAAPAVSSQAVGIPEVDFVPRRESLPHAAADLERRERQRWQIPADVLSERGIAGGGLMIMRAPEDADGVRRGDRLLVDGEDTVASPPGLMLVWDRYGVGLARCAVVRRGDVDLIRTERPGAEPRELRPKEDVELLGRVVSHWRWL